MLTGNYMTVITALIVLLPVTSFPSVINVPLDQPTIQGGIDASIDGDTVLVAPGVYSGPGNRDISYNGKKIVVKSVAGPSVTIIDLLQSTRAFDFTSDNDTTCVLDGFTIRNGNRYNEAGALRVVEGSVIIKNCVFKNNLSTHGGAVYARSESTVYFRRCSFIGNRATKYGGAVFCQFETGVYFEECLFLSNSSPRGGAVATYKTAKVTLSNCTLVGNTGSDVSGFHIHNGTDSLFVSNSIIAYGTSNIYILMVGYMKFECTNMFGNISRPYGSNGDWVGSVADQANMNGNFSAEPMFCDTADGNFQLSVMSPCMPDNNECGALIGALGLGCDYVCGDISNDGYTNVADLELLLELYFSDTAQWPIYWPAADMNCDSWIRIDDIVLLVNYLGGYGPQPCCDASLPGLPDLVNDTAHSELAN